jgi:hypothetical protein
MTSYQGVFTNYVVPKKNLMQNVPKITVPDLTPLSRS